MAECGGRAAASGSLFPMALILAAGILFQLHEKIRKRGLLLFILLVCCLGGWFRMTEEMKEGPLEAMLASGAIETENRSRAEAEGRISQVLLKDGNYTIILEPATVRAGGTQYEEKRLMISAKESRDGAVPEEGMYLYAKGKAELFQEARNPGEFDYRLYYRSQKLRCRLRADKMEIISGERPAFQSQLIMFRRFVKEALAFLYQEEDRGIFQAVLLGDKSSMDSDIRELYQDGGIAHVLAVSGLHVSLIGMSLYGFLRKRGVGYGWAGTAAAILLFFYGALAGFGASVFRAVFMVFCSFLASYLGRTYDLLSAMALSLILLASDSPYLLFTSGLQLSYGAVGAVGLAGNMKIHGSPLFTTMSASIAIQIVTLPVILYHFFEFPLYGLFLNLVVIPLMAYAAGSGIISVGLYGIWKAAEVPGVLLFAEGSKVVGMGGRIGTVMDKTAGILEGICHGAAGPGHYILTFYRELCRFSLKLPFSTVAAGRPSLACIAFYYGVLAVLYFHLTSKNSGALSRKEENEFNGKQACLFACALLLLMVKPRVSGMEVWFLDVGQGDGIFFRTGTAAVLTDCGSSQYKSVGKNRLVPFLKSKGIRRLDYIFISHADSDHINGIVWMLENETDLQVGTIIMPGPGRGEEEYREIEELGRRRKTIVCYMNAGEKLERGELKITAVYPDASASPKDRNGHSLVLSVRYRDFTMLLTGDVGQTGEEIMLDEKYSPGRELPGGNLSVLKAAHHGSATSTGEEFLKQLNPAVTVLSYGKGNSYGHPAKEVLKRLTDAGTMIWSTENSGAIHLTTDGRKMKAEGFLLDRNKGSGL